MHKIPISGGPHTGKTTLHNKLKETRPDFYFVPEPAEIVINRELQKQKRNPNYIPKIPSIDYRKFCPLVIEESLKLEAEIPKDTKIAILDRSLFDTLGYCRLNSTEEFIPKINKAIKLAGYTVAIFCAPVGNYNITTTRRETAEEALITHQFLSEAYEQSRLPIIHLPPTEKVEERLAILEQALETYI